MEEALRSVGAWWLAGPPLPEFWGAGPPLLFAGLPAGPSAYMSKDSIVSL